MDNPEGSPVLRIGELSRRLGVSDHVLRAWENRYGLLQPVRSAGGFRLYSEADAGRVRRMQAHLADGLSAAEAAKAVLGEDARADPRPSGRATRRPGEPRGPGRTPRGGRAYYAVDGERAVRCSPAGPRRLRRAGRAGGPGPAPVRPLPDRGAARRCGAVSHRTRGALGTGNGQHRPGALRQQRHPRPARRAGQGLGERARPPRRPGLPPRGASRPGADDLRHRAQPQRMADRLSRDEHPGGGAGADGRRDGARTSSSWPRPCRRTSTPTPRSSPRSPGARRSPWPEPAPHRNSRPPWAPGC